MISSTSCFTIFFNAILAPLILGEVFYCRTDGVTLTMVAIGSTLATTNQPQKIPSRFSEDKISEEAMAIIFQANSIVYASIVVTLMLLKNRLYVKVKNRLNDIHARTIETYHKIQGDVIPNHNSQTNDTEQVQAQHFEPETSLKNTVNHLNISDFNGRPNLLKDNADFATVQNQQHGLFSIHALREPFLQGFVQE